MAFEILEAELGVLLTQLQNEQSPEDRHELYLVIMRKLNELKAYGMPLPQDLVDLETALQQEFVEESKDGGGDPRGGDPRT
jgi:hypothetical protein